ncbi:4Fe-4S binding protein [Desulforhopalus singaporensis]|uniref:4Fe-4S dicluster domain-containing protein n=1 Tax=Desulforhopalus singaporensis TaxID=91360 RepID=A0A1H0TYV4_9BACT|nr:4Fe-4S binding protein [Desulforhopalus singaporensis]SDP58868.1 4Fe-4S dicluster domain-containing protein [Desulforhopalus singaporensis]
MKISRIRPVYFSPTSTSRKIVEAIAEGFSSIKTADPVDLTYPGVSAVSEVGGDELAIIAVPVYAGRVAPLAAERLRTIRGGLGPAVVVVLYGNRDYEDALIELRDIANGLSFVTIAGGAFIGEHSFSSQTVPLAPGRPDENDLAVAKDFGSRVDALLDVGIGNGLLEVPGNVPYKKRMGKIPATPQFNGQMCSECGFCVDLCPAGAILFDGQVSVDEEACIFCCSCVKNCPEGAVAVTAPLVRKKIAWLYENCAARKEPELFY